ncbi:MAG: hypothetical protein AB7G13_24770 [Lautropia sp.]
MKLSLLGGVEPADLTYNIASGLLSGRVDQLTVRVQAGSGGRAGSKTPGALNWWLANNPLATRVKMADDKSRPGGPLPMGRYRVVPHESRSNWLRLLPESPESMHGRTGMAIHGRGPRGSDGCIVPTDFTVVQQLYRVLVKRKAEQRPDAVLEVVAIGTDLDRQARTA